jgi:hypothetical protein
MHRLIKNYLCCSIIYWFTAITKTTSMLGKNINRLWISDHEPGPTLFN